MKYCTLLLAFLALSTARAQVVRPHFIRVADSRLYVEESGRGPALLLLHGGLLDHRQWAPQVKAWSRRFRVLNCDLRKHGFTQDGDSTFANADALARVLDSLGVRQAHVLGLSLGAVAALDFTLAYPARVHKLVLASPGLIGFDLDQDSALVANNRRQAAARQQHDTLAYAEWFVRSWVDGPHRQPAQTPAPVRALAAELVRYSLRHHRWTTGLRFHTAPPPRQRLDGVQVPALVLTGSLDWPGIGRLGDELAQRLPHARRVALPGAAHLLNLEQPRRFAREVQAFLREPESLSRK